MKQDLLRRLGNIEQVAYVREYVFASGKAKGMNVLEFNNGLLSFTVSVDRGLDIIDFRYMNTNLGFLSKNGVVGSHLAHTAAVPFSKSFEGGFLYTCGLDNIGVPEGDAVLHGSMTQVPAVKLKIDTRWENDEYLLSVEGEMHNTSLFGENFVLRRRISTSFMSESIEIRDELANEEFTDMEYKMLYHFNMGYPLLDDCTRIEGPFTATKPRNEWANLTIDACREMHPPIDGLEERCYFHTIEVQKPVVSVINERAGLRLDLEFNRDNLDRFVEWKSMRSGDYALGLEPCSTDLDDKHGKIIPPGGSIVNEIKISVKDIERKII
ncbi:MAG: aldose 1-epimerase family protein [Christensenellales bacterium]